MKNLCLMLVDLTDETFEKISSLLGEKYRIITKNQLNDGTEYEKIEIILGNPSDELLSKCKNLKWLQLESSGADRYAKILDKSKTVLTNATGAYGHAIAEYLTAGIFSLYKKLNLYRDNQSKCLWRDEGKVKTVAGSNVLVVGLGDIGSNFAKIMNRLGSNVYAIKRTRSKKPDYVKELYTMDSLDNLLPNMDIVALCLPNSDSTRYLFTKDRFEKMKPTAVIANVGRGNAVDNNALCEALHSKMIYGALLDVTDPEPLPAEHPLWKEPMAIITPHTSGGHHAEETVRNIENIILENVERYSGGKELSYLVDFDTGYGKK